MFPFPLRVPVMFHAVVQHTLSKLFSRYLRLVTLLGQTGDSWSAFQFTLDIEHLSNIAFQSGCNLKATGSTKPTYN